MTKQKHKTVLERNEKGQITKTAGRRPLYSDDELVALSRRICEYIKVGNYVTTSAKAAGVNENTFWSYYKKGKAGNPKYKAFYEEIVKAEAEAEIIAVAMVRKAMPDNWVAAMTFLERKFPDRWSRRENVHVEGGVDVNVQQKQPVLNIVVSEEAKRVATSAAAQPIVDAEVIEDKIYTR